MAIWLMIKEQTCVRDWMLGIAVPELHIRSRHRAVVSGRGLQMGAVPNDPVQHDLQWKSSEGHQ